MMHTQQTGQEHFFSTQSPNSGAKNNNNCRKDQKVTTPGFEPGTFQVYPPVRTLEHKHRTLYGHTGRSRAIS